MKANEGLNQSRGDRDSGTKDSITEVDALSSFGWGREEAMQEDS